MRGPNPPRRSGLRLRLRPRLPWTRAWRAELSAYADDELTSAQRERAQARLGDSPERRQWLAEIEHVQQTLALLSTAELPRSFELSETQFAAARAAHAQPLNERATAVRAIPLRLATAGAVASLVALATVSGFDMLDDPDGSAPLAATPEPTAAAVTTAATADAQTAQQSAAQAADPPAAPIETEPAEQTATVAATRSEPAQQSATAAVQSQEPEPTAAPAAAEEAQAETEQAQPLAQAEQTAAEDTPPAITAEQQEAARDPARGAVTAGINTGQSQSQSATPEHDAPNTDQTTQAEPAADAVDAADDAGADTASTDADAQPEAEAQSQPAAEPEQQSEPAALSGDEADASQPVRVIVVSTSGQDGERVRRIQIPGHDQHTVHRSADRHADDWPIPARPQAAGEVSADPSWETPVQIALAAVTVAALLLWAFLWNLNRRRAT